MKLFCKILMVKKSEETMPKRYMVQDERGKFIILDQSKILDDSYLELAIRYGLKGLLTIEELK